MKKKSSVKKIKSPPAPVKKRAMNAASANKKFFSKPVMIVAGEHSGDLLGSDIVRALKKKGADRFFGTGGDRMAKEGVELTETIENMSVMGFVEVFRVYRKLKALALKLADQAEQNKTRIAVLVDYPGFNLRLAEMLKAKGIKVVFLVSPQIWAWRYGRIKHIKKVVDLMLVLFPFEKDIYDREGVNCELIGHPLVRRIPELLKSETPVKKIPGITVGLLPGSRRSEILRHMTPMLDAAVLIQKKFEKIRFLVPCADASLREHIEKELSLHKNLKVEVYDGNSLSVMEASNLLILSSGTATLEGAYFKKPMIVIYSVKWINFLIASIVARVRFVGLVNILARKQVALELLQKEITPENIASEAVRILTNKKYRENITSELDFVVSQLGKGNPALKAADSIIRNF